MFFCNFAAQKSENQFLYMYSKKNIIKVSYPIFLGLLAQNIINVTDTAFLGHVGEIELGASAIGGLFYICFFTLAFGFSIGSQILMARRNGEGKTEEIGKILMQGSIFSFMIAIVLLILSFFIAKPFMSLMLSSEKVQAASLAFFNIRVWGLLFSFINTMYRAFYVAITRTKVLTLNAIVMATINIVLDYGLIFGELGLPKMGLEGAALASVISEAGSLLFFIIYTRITVDSKKYGLHFTLKIDLKTINHILGVSIFMMFQQFIPLATWFVFFIAIEHLGERQLAIANVVRSIYILALIPIHSMSTTANTMVSNAMGAGNTDRVIEIIKRITKICLLLAGICAFIMVAAPELLLSIYTEDSTLINEAIPSVWVIAGALMIAAMSNVHFNGISGTGNTKSALIIEIAAQIIYTIYVIVAGWFLKWPVAACFVCEIIYYALLLLGSKIYLNVYDWKKTKV